MADKRCENGHFIDESWDLCPYCPQENGEPEIPVVRPARMQPDQRPAQQRPGATSVPGPAPGPPRREAPQPGPPGRREAVPPGPPPPRRESPPPVEPPPMERTVAVQKIDMSGPGAAAQPRRYVVGWLVGLTGDSRGESYPLRMGRNVLGRERRCDVVVNDEQASSHHADLVFRPEELRFILMDHNSTNGTYVNEAEIEPRRDLASGDVVRIGAQRYLFVSLCGEGYIWDSEGALQ